MADVTTNYTTLQAYLAEQKNAKDKDLYSHLTKVMSHLVTNIPPNQALNKLEEASYLIKKGKVHSDQFLPTSVPNMHAQPS